MSASLQSLPQGGAATPSLSASTTQSASEQSARASQSLSIPSWQVRPGVSLAEGLPQSSEQVQLVSSGSQVPSPQQVHSPKQLDVTEQQSKSAQSAAPSQSSSIPSLQFVSEPIWHSASAQSRIPSQSLSRASAHWASKERGSPQSATQLQDVSTGSHVPLPQQTDRQAESAQSAFPLQSLSIPSVQFVSDGGKDPQSAGQLPVHRSRGAQVPLGHVVHGGKGHSQLMPKTPLQSR
jgi:hypothetical protein